MLERLVNTYNKCTSIMGVMENNYFLIIVQGPFNVFTFWALELIE